MLDSLSVLQSAPPPKRLPDAVANAIEGWLMSSRLPTISLFTGAGGLDLGAHGAGCKTRVAVEIDSDCLRTLKLNRAFSGCHIVEDDLRNVRGAELLEKAGIRRGELALLIGGPPCQPFSKAAYWTSTGEEARRRERLRAKNGYGTVKKSPRSEGRPFNPSADDRSNLVLEYVRVLRETKPLGFVFENVMSITHPASRKMFDAFLEGCSSVGYSYDCFCLNAVHYGVPQTSRLRKIDVPPGVRFFGTVFRRDLAAQKIAPVGGYRP